MGETSELRCWEELIPDALGLIFSCLPWSERLVVVPQVCKSWGRAVSGPDCWQDIDIEEWSQRCKPEQLDRMLRMLVYRSRGSLRRLRVSGLTGDSLFSFIAHHAGFLQVLEIPRTEITDAIVEQIAARLSAVTFLDVGGCQNISGPALESFGTHCRSLVGLRRTMHPLEIVDKVSQDDEAHAIAATMPKLKHLDLGYCLLTTPAVLEILSRCADLEVLDLRGCWEVKLDEGALKRHAGLKLLGPEVVDSCYDGYDRDLWEDSDYSDFTAYSWEEFMEDAEAWDDRELEGLEVRFYGGGSNEAFAGLMWPPSP